MHVLGAGALGCLWSTRLALAGARPMLLLRAGSPKQRLSAGRGGVAELHVEQPWSAGAPEVVAEVRTEVVGDARHAQAIRAVLVVTKAPATVEALEALAPRLEGAVVLLLSNGALGILERIRASRVLAAVHVVLGSTTHGAWTRGDFHAVHAGVGETCLGRAPGSGLEEGRWQDILEEVSRAGLGATDEGDGILGRLWLKLAANAVINPLTALWEVLTLS